MMDPVHPDGSNWALPQYLGLLDPVFPTVAQPYCYLDRVAPRLEHAAKVR